MYERFTDDARKAIVEANNEATRLNHEYMGTEHILLGIVKIPWCAAVEILNDLGVEAYQVISEVERIVPAGGPTVIMGKLPQSPRAKIVHQLAIEEFDVMGSRHVGTEDLVGTEHLLIALLREQDGVAAQVLGNLGVSIKSARTAIFGSSGPPRKN